MKIIILTSLTTANIYLVNNLTDKKNVIGKVIEKRPIPGQQKSKMEIRINMAKKYGILKTINKLLYNKLKSYFNGGDNDYLINELFDGNKVEYEREVPTIVVPGINDDRTVDFIKEYEPDIIAVCGTNVIKPKVFKLAKYGTINIHVGITPEYRSADPIFWALYNNEPDKVGVTIHFIDEGIDTGDIIYQEPVGVDRGDTLTTLYCKCIKTGAMLMSKAIDDIEKSKVKGYKKDVSTDKAYYHMDLGIWQYILFRRRVKNLKRNLK